MKRDRLRRVVTLVLTLCVAPTLKGANEMLSHQFANCGVEFGYKEIAIEARKNTLYTIASEPTKEASQCALTVNHPRYTRAKYVRENKVTDGAQYKQVVNPSKWPHSVFGQLQLIFADGAFHGSGTLVSPHHVLTCAHNVFDTKTGEWAREIKFTPALNNNQAPFGVVQVISAFIYKAYEEVGDEKADIALLALARPIGYQTGWAGLMATTNTRALKMEKPEITGYPGDKGGTQMWTMFNEFNSISDTRFTYVIDTSAGQSGSAVWIPRDGAPYALGVHTHGSSKYNIGTRISEEYFRQLHECMCRTGELKTTSVKPSLPSGGGTSYEKPLLSELPTRWEPSPSPSSSSNVSVILPNRKIIDPTRDKSRNETHEEFHSRVEDDIKELLKIAKMFNDQRAFSLLKEYAKRYQDSRNIGVRSLIHTSLGEFYEKGTVVIKNIHQALEEYKIAFEIGNNSNFPFFKNQAKELACTIARIYRDGNESVRSGQEAIYWFDRATNLYEIGCIYRNGMPGHVMPDREKALHFLKKQLNISGYVSRKLQSKTQYQIGCIYKELSDLKKAEEAFKKVKFGEGSKEEYAESCYFLAQMWEDEVACDSCWKYNNKVRARYSMAMQCGHQQAEQELSRLQTSFWTISVGCVRWITCPLLPFSCCLCKKWGSDTWCCGDKDIAGDYRNSCIRSHEYKYDCFYCFPCCYDKIPMQEWKEEDKIEALILSSLD